MNKEIKEVFQKRHDNLESLESDISKLSNEKLEGDAFEYFSYFYFLYFKDLYKVKKIYLSINDNYTRRHNLQIPQEIKDKIKLENSDYGVDGVIVTEEDEIIAYQAKFRASRTGVTGKELSTFWGESEYADHRIIITNCINLPVVTDKKKKQSTITYSSLVSLGDDFFINLYNFFYNDSPIKKEKFTPKDYQKEIIEDVRKGFQDSNRGKLIAACGVGKTLMSLWIQEELETNSVIYMVPSLALIEQTLVEWSIHHNFEFDFICVCSDESVTNNDDIVTSVNQSSFPVTTQSEEVSSFLRHKTRNKKIVFTTYHSLDIVVSATMENPEFEFDLGIFDESHRTAGTKSSQMFIYGLSDEYIRINKRLFMTATEKVVSNRIIENAKEAGQVIFSMDDTSRYGETLASINFGQAIEKGVISDYKIAIVAMSEDDISELNIGGVSAVTELGEDDYLTDLGVLVKQLILVEAINDLEVNKIITYHNSVSNAKYFINGNTGLNSLFIYPLKELIQNKTKYNSDAILTGHVNGQMSAGKRKRILKEFERSEVGIVSNARCLTEGVDVPVIDAVYFCDSKNSLIDIVQAVGRALRKSKNKTNDFSYIVIPMIIPQGAEATSAIDYDRYETILNVVHAMRSQDERLVDEINAFNYGHTTGVYTKGGLKDRIVIYGSDKINLDDLHESICFNISTAKLEYDNDGKEKTVWTGKNARKSSLKRVFKSIADYNLEPLKDNLIVPILGLYETRKTIPYKDVTVGKSHNNRSHTLRFGAIRKVNSNTYLTEVGNSLIQNNFDNYLSLAQSQLLKYHSVNKDDHKILFPYRAILKVIKETSYLTKLEFLFALYTLRSTEISDIEEAVNGVFHIRETYPNIETINSNNQKIVLDMLNTHFDCKFSFNDIWTTKTTTSNQFNYFKNHLSAFEGVIDASSSGIIKMVDGAQSLIEKLLQETSYIERFSYNDIDQLEEYYSKL